jgi:hypothetical protein
LWLLIDNMLWLGCSFCRLSVNTICGRVIIGLSLLSAVSKHTMWTYYDWVYCCCLPSVNIICGRIMIGLSLLSSVSKDTMWSYYDWLYCCCLPSVNIICGRIMSGLSLLSFVSKHNMRSCYDWVVVVFFRLLAQHVVVLWLDCRCCRNDNPIIIRPHIVFTDERQQWQPNHNATTYYVYWRTATTTIQS